MRKKTSKRILTIHSCLCLFLYRKIATKEIIPSMANTKDCHQITLLAIIAKTAINMAIKNK